MNKRILITAIIGALVLCPSMAYADAPAVQPAITKERRESREYDTGSNNFSDRGSYQEAGGYWNDAYNQDSYWDDSYDLYDDGYWDDDAWDTGYWDDGYWDDDDWDDGYWDDSYWDDDSAGSRTGNTGKTPWDEKNFYGGQSELLTWENGLGSAGELDGRIVVVSIFLSDAKHKWDFSQEMDQLRREHGLTYLGIAADWITENAAKWEKHPEFIYDWEQHDDLYYEMQTDEDLSNEYEDPTYDMNEMIENYVDPASLLKEYNADSILFLAFVNSPKSNSTVSYTIPYDDGLGDDTMEICYIFVCSDGEEETPAAYAHEILHTFGAPDLYTADNPAENYNIDEDFVSYCEVNHPNEIMLTTYDVYTDEPYYDHISNELTEITAYYIGWTDHSKEAEEFGLQESQHVS